ncbi:LigA protein [Pelomyxa schiedti]|nr:LigA protein [Pelomyxa schiedti]
MKASPSASDDVDFPLLPNGATKSRMKLGPVFAVNTIMHTIASIVGLSRGLLVAFITWFVTGRVWVACIPGFLGVISMTVNGSVALATSSPTRVTQRQPGDSEKEIEKRQRLKRANSKNAGFQRLAEEFPGANDASYDMDDNAPKSPVFLSPHVSPCTVAVSAIWGLFDILLSSAFAIISMGISVWFAEEPDGQVCEDWKEFHAVCIASFSVNIFAAVVQFVAITMCIVACAFSCTLSKIHLEEPDHNKETTRCQKCRHKCCKTYSRLHCCVIVIFILFAVALVCTVIIVTAGPVIGMFTDHGKCSDQDPDCYATCNENDPGVCMLPFPSTFYMKLDNTTPSGWKLALGEKSTPLLKALHFSHIGVDVFNEMDGFSTTGPLLCFFEDVSTNGTITAANPENYTDPNATTVLIDTTTRKRVAHWVELDGMDEEHPLLIIQPAQALSHGTRYVMGIRGLISNSGEQILRSPHFNSVMTNQTGDEWEYLNSQVLAFLHDDGWTDDEVLLAWDFVTISEDYSLGRAKLMLQESATLYSSLQYTIERVDNSECKSNVSNIGKSIWGFFEAPKFVTKNRGGRLISRPGEQTIQTLGETLKVQFLIEVPCSILLNPSPSFIMQYGHSMLMDRSEIQASWIRDLAYKNQWITYAVDWYGFSRLDLLVFSNILFNDPDNFVSIVECTQQAFINANLMTHLMTNQMLREPELQVSEESLIDPTAFGFYGNSEGGILGGAYIALSDMLDHGITNVAGSPFALILPRSSMFKIFNTIMINFLFYDQRDIRLMLSVFQIIWDAGEVGGWLNTLDKPILIQAAIDDPVVCNHATHFYARSLNATLIYPAYRDVWPLAEARPTCCPPPDNGVWMVEWKYEDVPALPDVSAPADKDAPMVHMCPQQEPAGQQQVTRFLETGYVVQYCSGVCTDAEAC